MSGTARSRSLAGYFRLSTCSSKLGSHQGDVLDTQIPVAVLVVGKADSGLRPGTRDHKDYQTPRPPKLVREANAHPRWA